MLKLLSAALVAAQLLSAVAFDPTKQRPREVRRKYRARQLSYEPYIDAAFTNNTDVVLSIDTKDTSLRNETAPYLYGLMFEDINHCGDGGIYAEMITNRAFQGSTVTLGTVPYLSGSVIIGSENPVEPFGPVLTGWAPIGGAILSLDRLHPLSEALPTVMQVDIPENATGEVGFLNYGWWGMDVRPQTYTFSFYALANAPRYKGEAIPFTASLRSNFTGETWASTTLSAVTLPTVDYIQLNGTIDNTVWAPDANNTFAITVDASLVAGQTFYFDLISLFPETFKGRQNGLRKDIAEAFYDMKPQFLRFPGGNNLEGISVYTRWNWRKTIGPLKDRPGRPADWEYYNTDGLGLLEYLEWCEDMDMQPVLAVYAGFSLDVWGQEGTSFSEQQMQYILNDTLDELEYIMGDTSTPYGALRAQHGHPEPFELNFIEIGNEDWFSDSYPYRWPIMYNGLKAKYPNITYISTAYNEALALGFNYTIELPPGTYWDTHHYEDPDYFIDNFNFYDNWEQANNFSDVGILLGENSVFQIDTPSHVINFSDPTDIHIAYPRVLSALGEGVYALGGERNPSVVKMSSYAPSLQNLAWYNWTPNMILFTSLWNQTTLSVSYWQRWMFAHFRGTQTLPTTSSKGGINPLFWVASIDEPSNSIYFKVINIGNGSVVLGLDFDTSYSSVNGTILTAPDPNWYNFINNQTAVIPQPINISNVGSSDGKFMWNVPRFSISVLQFDL